MPAKADFLHQSPAGQKRPSKAGLESSWTARPVVTDHPSSEVLALLKGLDVTLLSGVPEGEE